MNLESLPSSLRVRVSVGQIAVSALSGAVVGSLASGAIALWQHKPVGTPLTMAGETALLAFISALSLAVGVIIATLLPRAAHLRGDPLIYMALIAIGPMARSMDKPERVIPELPLAIAMLVSYGVCLTLRARARAREERLVDLAHHAYDG